MTSRLKKREDKIHQLRSTSAWDDFILELASWYPVSFYNRWNVISVYPDSERVWWVVSSSVFEDSRHELPILEEWNWDVFENFWSLMRKISLPNTHHYSLAENAQYANIVSTSKNVYLSFWVTWWCENVMYSLSSKINSSSVFDSVMVRMWSDQVYWSSCVFNSYQIFYSRSIVDSHAIWYSENLIWCHECIWCIWLENQSYHIDNISYSKDEYFARKEFVLEALRNTWITKSLIDSSHYKCTDVTWVLYCYNTHSSRHVIFWWHEDWLSHVHDAFMASWGENYAAVCHAAWDSVWVFCSALIRKWFSIYYSYFCEYCSFCFWCIWLKNRSYCIFNKQYEKDEWFRAVEQLFVQMEWSWQLGKFFPGELCPFFVNDSAAGLLLKIDRNSIQQKWYLWRDEEIAVDIPDWMEKVHVSDLPLLLSEDTDYLLKKVLVDESWKAYRLLKMEYDFLKRYWLSIPQQHRLTRLTSHFR